ncbi:MAG: HAMP domain-containing sensor histidine kinase [Bacillota bacterium]|nr:HAMP domain-containing sensor histidine kinase [Bacillota bacterium]
MATRLKNKYLYALIFTIAIYTLGITMLSAFDIINNKDNLENYSYFKSYSYKADLKNYFQKVLPLITEFKDYSQKSEVEKLNEIKRKLAGANESQLKDYLLKNEGRYSEIVAAVASEKALRYYIKDNKTREVYTNIEGSDNLDDYVKKEAVYVDKFPRDMGSDTGVYLYDVNAWFRSNDYDASFIFVKPESGFSQMEQNYKYYNSIRERVEKEEVICAASLIIGAVLLILLKLKFKGQSWGTGLYRKIPLDLRALIFLVSAFIMMAYLSEVYFFYAPISISHFIKLSVAAIYAYYLKLSIGSALRLIQNKAEFAVQLQRSTLYEIGMLLRESLNNRGTLLREISLFLSTVLFGMFTAVGFIALTRNSHEVMFLVSLIYAVLYLVLVPIRILRRAVALGRIIKGTDAIASGNLDYVMKENGDTDYINAAKNINNMKDSFKSSVESQVRSERLKTELITNVSHDLKTPLTSIVSYVSLLKKGGLSEEESKKYIEVLEQKSQRLKVLIEDLFEASKVSSGSIELVIEKVDIASLLRQALGEFDQKISKSSLIFRTNIPAYEVYLNLDGKRTWRVFENLIGNALKYSQPGSRVYIDLKEKENSVEVTIKNMASYEMDFDVDEIFERFKRGDKARSTEGSGLGLSIAKSIVELQGGYMKIDIDGDLFKVTTVFKK